MDEEAAKELGGPGLVHTAAHIAEPRIHAGGIHRLGGRPGNGAGIKCFKVMPLIVIHVVGLAGGIVERTAPVCKVAIAIAAVAVTVPVTPTVPPRLPSVKGSVVARGIERRRRRRAALRAIIGKCVLRHHVDQHF
jgi:hypothetical protein